MNEADTCREYVLPKLQQAGWDQSPHSFSEQQPITDGRIVTIGTRTKRLLSKRPDYLLRYASHHTLAVVEAKREGRTPGAGLQQAKEYAEMLKLNFAYATNGHGIVEFDYLTGLQSVLKQFPSPDELWSRLYSGKQDNASIDNSLLLTPYQEIPGKPARYYQEIAINRAFQAILSGQRRALLTMATGTGKTFVAFQICWRLWNVRWNAVGAHRRPRILFLADRNVLVDDPKDKMFVDFGDARHKIEGGQVVKSREMYFAIYQSLAKDENRPGLFREYPPDFFDLIIIDECHRGSARDDSNWREILDYFAPAYQLGMTATPLHEVNRDTYAYFGNALYTYSLRQGIDDGFLAPYRVHRVISDVDAVGWRPYAGQRDRTGRLIPDEEYQTKDFERLLVLNARTTAIARHLTDFLKRTDRFAKTIVFCVDQDHAEAMMTELNNLNSDLTRQYPDYVCRVTSDEGTIGRGHLSRFQEVEKETPVILTTSKLLTTGVDAQTCKNIVIAQVILSITEFKQIIGRGTRVREDCGKLYFNIIDYTGSAMQRFADPEFDGDPDLIHEEVMDATGVVTEGADEEQWTGRVSEGAPTEASGSQTLHGEQGGSEIDRGTLYHKYYVDGGFVEIIGETVHELDSQGQRLRTISYTEHAGIIAKTLYHDESEMRQSWINAQRRKQMIAALGERGIDLDDLRRAAKQPTADPFDLLCHLAFNAPLYTRRQRAERMRSAKPDFFERYGAEARAILTALVEKYTDYGMTQFTFPDILKLTPISEYGNVVEIVGYFGGADQLRAAVDELQALLYAA